MDQKKIDRINYLARKAKADGLTEEERKEQKALRDEYRESFKKSMQNIMSNTYIEYPDGSRKKVERKPDAKC